MSKTVTLRLKDKFHNTFLEAALAENRPLSKLIETAAMNKIREQRFVDIFLISHLRKKLAPRPTPSFQKFVQSAFPDLFYAF
jgi:hypothetical protein